ncbi:MAG: N-acetylmuramoyl-L-alanine amidase, partial [Ruminococcus sp.]|nr:N-acetylmuramoyl-L-alanine amidase [Ruminococcus sp.]
ENGKLYKSLLQKSNSVNGWVKESADSSIKPTDTSLPAIVSPKATQGKYSNKIVITWGSAYNSKVSKYLIVRKAYGSDKWEKLAYVSNTTNKYVDKISGNTKYYSYKVLTCKNENGKLYKSLLQKSNSVNGWCKVTICIDPGHYGTWNNNYSLSGAAGSYPYSEAGQMLKLGKYLNTYLNNYNIATKITRTSANEGSDGVNIFVNGLETRGKYSEGCNFFISLHTNATSGSWNVSSNSVLVIANKKAYASDEIELAANLGTAVANTMAPCGTKAFKTSLSSYGASSSGLIYRKGLGGKDYYGVLRSSNAVGTPGVLIEHSYHVNPNVRKFLLDNSNLEKLAKAEAETIAQYYGFPT